MALRYAFNIFLKELILFSLTLAAGLFVGYRLLLKPIVGLVPAVSFALNDLVILILAFITFSLLLSHFPRVAQGIFKVFLVLVILSGAQLVFGVFFPYPWDFGAAAVVVLALALIPTVIIHDLAVILGIVGISVVIGTSITPLAGVAILAILSIYDILAVYKTKHMIRLAEGMIQSKAIFGFLVPVYWSGFFTSKIKAVIGRDFLILGSGDIAVPLLFVISLISTSLTSATVVAGFTLLGLFLSHLIFVNQQERQAMAALPPIATTAIIGYLVSLWL